VTASHGSSACLWHRHGSIALTAIQRLGLTWGYASQIHSQGRSVGLRYIPPTHVLEGAHRGTQRAMKRHPWLRGRAHNARGPDRGGQGLVAHGVSTPSSPMRGEAVRGIHSPRRRSLTSRSWRGPVPPPRRDRWSTACPC